MGLPKNRATWFGRDDPEEIELEAPPVEQLPEALRFEREQSVEHSYIRAAVLDTVNVLHALKLPVEILLK